MDAGRALAKNGEWTIDLAVRDRVGQNIERKRVSFNLYWRVYQQQVYLFPVHYAWIHTVDELKQPDVLRYHGPLA